MQDSQLLAGHASLVGVTSFLCYLYLQWCQKQNIVCVIIVRATHSLCMLRVFLIELLTDRHVMKHSALIALQEISWSTACNVETCMHENGAEALNSR